MIKLQNVLTAGAISLSAIALLYGFTATMIKEKPDTVTYVPMVEIKRCDEKCQSEHSAASTWGAGSTPSERLYQRTPMTSAQYMRYLAEEASRVESSSAGNLSLSKFSEIDQFGYPTYDPRIDGSRKGSNWYQPKKVYVGLDKHGKGVYADPSIGSSGELDRLSLGPSRSTPENQRQWSQHTSSTESIFIPKSDDPRYY